MSASDQKRRLSDLERGTPPACEQSHVPKVPRVDTLYTIFFVAATTIFSFSHSVGHEGYRFLAAFFVVTWSTWFQVMLYRSSFGVGDITDGLAYAAQFLYMTLFGALAVQRYTRNTEVVLMLMVVLSRFALGLQYLRALWLAPGGSESRSRMLKVMLRTKVVSVVLLLLLDQGWWYAVLVIEAIVDAMIHGLGREATDEDVVGQRMRNLTLVMLAGSVLVVGREFVDLGLPNTLKLSVLEWSNINCFILTIVSDFLHRKRAATDLLTPYSSSSMSSTSHLKNPPTGAAAQSGRCRICCSILLLASTQRPLLQPLSLLQSCRGQALQQSPSPWWRSCSRSFKRRANRGSRLPDETVSVLHYC